MFKSMMYDTDIRNRGTDPREDRNMSNQEKMLYLIDKAFRNGDITEAEYRSFTKAIEEQY